MSGRGDTATPSTVTIGHAFPKHPVTVKRPEAPRAEHLAPPSGNFDFPTEPDSDPWKRPGGVIEPRVEGQ